MSAKPRSRGFSRFGFSLDARAELKALKRNSEKPRERG
jgi:hypothetical protein